MSGGPFKLLFVARTGGAEGVAMTSQVISFACEEDAETAATVIDSAPRLFGNRQTFRLWKAPDNAETGDRKTIEPRL